MADLSCLTLLFLPHFTEFDDLPLSVSKTDMATIVKVMQLPDSGLEIRDRMWLKITIANAVIGLLFFAVVVYCMYIANIWLMFGITNACNCVIFPHSLCYRG